MQYLLILYYGLHATTPSVALLNGPFDAATCHEMADIGRDAKHVTTCGAIDTFAGVLALHRCTFTDADVDALSIEFRNYTCQE